MSSRFREFHISARDRVITFDRETVTCVRRSDFESSTLSDKRGGFNARGNPAVGGEAIELQHAYDEAVDWWTGGEDVERSGQR